ncbi:MAG: Crp/Fnr family transcriptional regulator [Flavitalea sp.]
MYQNLIDYIQEYSGSSLSSSEVDLIKEVFQPKKLRKRQYLLKEGHVMKHTAFITRGAMRQYFVDDKGNEKIVHFFIERHWASDRESLISGEPAVSNIDAWEDTEMLIITPKDFFELTEKVPALALMHRVMDQKHAIALHKRLNSMIVASAETRYLQFAVSYPQFVQRFPQHQIASYLGITKETLSRVKRQSMR